MEKRTGAKPPFDYAPFDKLRIYVRTSNVPRDKASVMNCRICDGTGNDQ
ncbi:MAG: hypothetical protein P9M00_12735 [Candidatus Tritonobacter lacicola]|nr:hypothetical protein [Candidatus Tritonobacter lacicola]